MPTSNNSIKNIEQSRLDDLSKDDLIRLLAEMQSRYKKELEEISLRIKSNTKKCLKVIVNDTAIVNDK